MANNYGNYYNAQQQQTRHYNNFSQHPSYSSVPSSNAQPSLMTSGSVQWPSRYQYQSTNTYSGGNTNNAWYGVNNATANDSNRDERGSRSEAQYQYSYRTEYDSSALGSLAYASSLNASTAGRSSGNNHQPSQQVYAQHSHPQQQLQQAQYGQEVEASNIYGQQQQQQQQPHRPESVNSVGSARSNSNVRQVERPQSNRFVNAAYQPSQGQPPQPQSQNAQRSTTPTTLHRWNPSNYQPHDRENQAPDHSASNLTKVGMNQVFTRYNHTSRPSNESPVAANQSEAHTSVEPVAQTTVDPTQVYDPYLDYQRQAAKRAAEDEAAKTAESAGETTREAVEESNAEEDVRAPENQVAENSSRPTAKKPTKSTGTQSRTKKKPAQSESEQCATPKRKRKSKAADTNDDQATAAARTLMQTAMSAGGDLESQMRLMFQKMREFNEKDPDLLSKLWQEERDDYLAKANSQSSTHATDNSTKASTAKTNETAKGSKPKTSKGPTTNQEQPDAATVKSDPQAQDPQKVQQEQIKHNTSSVHSPASPISTAQQAAGNMPSVSPPANLITTSTNSVTRSSGTTIWPADKKVALANAAANLLRGYPANRGKTITASQIAALLDTNPSYIELCKKIESLGLHLDRSAFAKALLAAVPDVTKVQKQSGASQAAQSKQPNGNATSPVSDEQKLQEAQAKLMDSTNILDTEKKERASKPRTSQPRKSDGDGTTKAETLKASNIAIDPQLEGLDAVKRFVDGPDQVANTTPTSKTNNRPKQLPKARTSQTPQASASLLKEDKARKRTFADLVDLTKLSDNEESEEPLPKRLQSSFDTTNNQLPTPPDTTLVDPRTTTNTASETVVQSGDLTRPSLPSQSNTIEPLRQAPIPLNHPIRTVPVAQPLDKYKAIRRSTYDPRTIARDVLLACGRHPDMRHLNAHYNTMRNAFPQLDNFVDLDTLRWDIIDPGGPPVGSGSQPQQSLAQEVMPLNDEDDEADDEDETPGRNALDHPAIIRQAVGAAGGDTNTRIDFRTGDDAYKMDKKIKGRPRRSDPGIRQHGDSDSTPKRGPGRPRASEGGRPSRLESPGGSSYAALRAQQVAKDGAAPKRGRPVGWRKWMQKGGDGTPAKQSSNKQKPPSPEPRYQVYKCEWEGCSAELHNLAKLRRHVCKLHGKANAQDGKYWCLWQDCGEVQSIHDKATMRTKSRWLHLSFANDNDWKTHVEKKHIMPVAWKLGDGPADGLSDAQDSDAMSEAYMSDRQGRRVTPQVTISEDQEDEARSIVPGRKVPKKTQEEHALDIQKRVEKEKQAIGVGVDKGGARLVNDKRRMGFIDDEDVAEVVSDED